MPFITDYSPYFPVVLQSVIGLPHRLSLILAGIAATQYAIFAIFPIFYIDRVGRRTALMFGSLACGLCMAGIAAGVRADNKVGGAFAVAFMFLFDDVFAWGIHAVAWMYACEINSL
jgi:Sugar (and other) transporter